MADKLHTDRLCEGLENGNWSGQDKVKWNGLADKYLPVVSPPIVSVRVLKMLAGTVRKGSDGIVRWTYQLFFLR